MASFALPCRETYGWIGMLGGIPKDCEDINPRTFTLYVLIKHKDVLDSCIWL
jgi:hypothetical protein